MILVRKKNPRKNSWLPFPSDQSGSILILVVWMIALFTFWVLASASAGIFSLGVGRRFEGDLKTYAVARSAVPYVQKILEDDITPKYDGENEEALASPALYEPQTRNEGTLQIFSFSPDPFTGYLTKKKGIIDEERKLNLNTANTDILVLLFSNLAGLKADLVKSLVESIEDWRDTDNDKREFGAERYEYTVLKKPYDCKNGPFESLEELLLVKGMNSQILNKVRPFLTVYGSGKVNLNTAPAQVLYALGIGESSVGGMMLYRAGLDTEPGTADDGVVQNIKLLTAALSTYISEQDAIQLTRLIKDDLMDVVSEAFSFSSEAKLDDFAYPVKIDVVMKKDGEILSWQET